MTGPLKGSLFFLLMLAPALPAAAEVRDVELGDPAADNSFANLVAAPVARLAGGGYAVAWNVLSRRRATLQWVRPDGSTLLGPGGRELPRTTDDDPVVAAHPSAGAFVAFTAETDHGPRIVVQSFAADASPRWGAEGVVAEESPGSGDQRFPQLLAGADGGVFVCFLRRVSAATELPVCQRLGSDGRPRWPGGRAAALRPGKIFGLRLVSDRKGGVLAFWSNAQERSAGGHSYSTLSLEGQRFSPQGFQLWGTKAERLQVIELKESLGFFTFLKPQAVTDGQGGAILAFGYQAGVGPVSVRAQRVDRDGDRLWGEGTTLAAGPTLPAIDSLSPAPDGGAFAVVLEMLVNGQTRFVLHRLGPDGRLARPFAGTVLSAPGRFQQDLNSQASFDGDRLRVLWSSHVLGSGAHIEVRIALFDRTGKRLSAPGNPPLVDGTAGRHYFAGFAFDAARDQGLAVWNLLASDLPYTVEGALFSGDTGLP
jgi:hypothetical protein